MIDAERLQRTVEKLADATDTLARNVETIARLSVLQSCPLSRDNAEMLRRIAMMDDDAPQHGCPVCGAPIRWHVERR